MRVAFLAAPLLAAACMNTMPVETRPAPVSASEMAFVQAGISDAMRDPGSAQFRRWSGYTLANGDRIICGEVNAKNALGAYVGFDPFYLRLRGSEPIATLVGNQAVSACNDAATGTMMVQPI